MGKRERNLPEKFKNRKIYSISRLQSYHNCQHGYLLNYIKRLKGKGNIYSVLGTKVHDMLELMQFGKMTNEEALKQFQLAVFETTQIEEHKFASEKIQENFIQSIEHCIKNYKPIDAKEFKSEMEFYTEVAGVVLIGYIDGVILNHDNTIEVVDYKTSSKYSGKDIDEHALQLILYAIALEQEYNAKVDKVKWNMLKYCWIRWQGATKPREMFAQRNQVVSKLRSELKKDLRKLEKSDEEIDLLLNLAEQNNDLSLLPDGIVDKYTISDGFVEYPFNDDTKKMLEEYVRTTVAEIEAKDETNEGQWTPIEITEKNSFFCSTLCDHKMSCETYKNFLKLLEEGNVSKFEQPQQGFVSTEDEMMKNLFG